MTRMKNTALHSNIMQPAWLMWFISLLQLLLLQKELFHEKYSVE